jgi:hypothetical protein
VHNELPDTNKDLDVLVEELDAAIAGEAVEHPCHPEERSDEGSIVRVLVAT